MPTLPDYPEISQIKHKSPGFLHRSRQFPFFQIKLTFEPSVDFSRNFFLWFWSSYYSFEWHFSTRIVYLFHHWYRLLFSTSFKTMYNVLTHTNILIWVMCTRGEVGWYWRWGDRGYCKAASLLNTDSPWNLGL